MNKKTLKTILVLVGFALLILVVVSAADFFDSPTEASVAFSNIKQAQPIPSSCTSSQNCGAPTCGIASGRGSSCGCGG